MGPTSRERRRSPALATLLALALWVAVPGPASAADPDCATVETEGSAGLDLRLLCTLGRIVGHYTGTTYDSPADVPVLFLGGLVAGVGAAVALSAIGLLRLFRHWARPRRPADEAWWTCPVCRSFNEATFTRCYHCGGVRPP